MDLRTTVETRLLQSDSPFAVHREDVGGETMDVFVQRARSLRSLLERSAAFGPAPYLIFADETISYAAHFDWVARAARRLQDDYGIRAGDRVAIVSANQAEWVILFWASIAIGALPVGLNAWWVRTELDYALALVEPSVVFADTRRLERLDGWDGAPVVGIDDVRQWREDPACELPVLPIDEDAPATILFSSGTTGRPKGIVATHRNILGLVGIQLFQGARAFGMEQALGVAGEPGGPGLVTTPLFHVSALYAGVITRMAAGGATVWTTGRFDPETVMQLIERFRCSGWGPMATMVQRLLNHPRVGAYDLSSMRFIGLGGSSIPVALSARIQEALPHAQWSSAVGYGQTECCALSTIAFGDELLRFPGTVGRPLPTVAIEIRDESGQKVDDGVPGEICVRSPLTTPGFWRDDAATAARFWPHRWLRTGDVGWVKEERLYVASRQSDLIIRGGENIYPAEIEVVLEQHPNVLEAAVVGRDDADLGQVPTAYLRVDAPVSHDALRDFCQERLAYFKVPVAWFLRETSLPRNATGKVLKNSLSTPQVSTFVPDDVGED